jgi:hypothetical protein
MLIIMLHISCRIYISIPYDILGLANIDKALTLLVPHSWFSIC